MLETAIAFIDQLGRTGGSVGREEEEVWGEKVETELGRGELLGVVVGCEFSFSFCGFVLRRTSYHLL